MYLQKKGNLGSGLLSPNNQMALQDIAFSDGGS